MSVHNLASKNRTQVIAVTAGKGGVGKSNVSINLGIGLSRLGKRVMVLDADLGLANIDVLLGLHAKNNLADVLEGNCSIDEVIIEGPSQLKIIPAASGIELMTNLSNQAYAGLINAFDSLTADIDTLIVDTAAGISNLVTHFNQAAHEVIVVVCDEPASITDAYALIKVLNQNYGIPKFHLLTNMVKDSKTGNNLFHRLLKVTDKFLDVQLNHIGNIPFDESLRQSVCRQRAVCDFLPNSRSAQALFSLAHRVESWKPKNHSNGSLNFFLEKMIQAGVSSE